MLANDIEFTADSAEALLTDIEEVGDTKIELKKA